MSIMECLILGLCSMNNDMILLWILAKFSKNNKTFYLWDVDGDRGETIISQGSVQIQNIAQKFQCVIIQRLNSDEITA